MDMRDRKFKKMIIHSISDTKIAGEDTQYVQVVGIHEASYVNLTAVCTNMWRLQNQYSVGSEVTVWADMPRIDSKTFPNSIVYSVRELFSHKNNIFENWENCDIMPHSAKRYLTSCRVGQMMQFMMGWPYNESHVTGCVDAGDVKNNILNVGRILKNEYYYWSGVTTQLREEEGPHLALLLNTYLTQYKNSN